MRRRTTAMIFPAALLLTTWLGPAPGWAIDLEEAKKQGFLGEMPNGYLGEVKSGLPPDVRALEDEVNRKRRQTYEDIARRNSTNLDAVEALAGETAIKKTKPGNFVELPSGEWRRK